MQEIFRPYEVKERRMTITQSETNASEIHQNVNFRFQMRINFTPIKVYLNFGYYRVQFKGNNDIISVNRSGNFMKKYIA